MSANTYKYTSPVGDIICTFAGPFLIKLDITGHSAGGAAPPLPAGSLRSELDAYFSGSLRVFRQSVKFIGGTDFEHKIWRALSEIPYGETRSYKWMAERAGSPRAVRAAGQALGKNPLPIILPCHRVISADGSLGGYSGGVAIKEWLLRHEQR